MQQQQRTVLVVASGLALAVLAAAVNRHVGADVGEDGGWFAYAPNTGLTFAPADRGPIWRDAAVWLVAIAVWAGISLRLYGGRPGE